MLVDGNGVALMCSIILAWERSPATVSNPGHCGSCPEHQKKQRRSLLLSLSFSSPIFGLIVRESSSAMKQHWFPHLSSLSIFFLYRLCNESGIPPLGPQVACTKSTDSSFVPLGYLKWKDYSCHVSLPYICKFKGWCGSQGIMPCCSLHWLGTTSVKIHLKEIFSLNSLTSDWPHSVFPPPQPHLKFFVCFIIWVFMIL